MAARVIADSNKGCYIRVSQAKYLLWNSLATVAAIRYVSAPASLFRTTPPDGQKADDDMDIASPHATCTGLTRTRDASQKPLDSYSWHELAKGWRRGEG